MNIGCWLPSVFHQKPSSLSRTRKQMKLKSLCAVLPAHTVTALLPGPVHIIKSKHILDSADFNAAPDSLFNSLGYPPLVASFSS